MSIRFVFKIAGATLATAFAVGFLSPAAQATPIVFYNDASTHTTERFTVGCGGANGDCAGVLEAVSDTSPLAWSSTVGEMLGGPSNASPASETTFVNGMLGTALSANTGNLLPSNSNSFQFSLDAGYLLVKVGGGSTGQAYALLRNLGGTPDVWFTKTGRAAGLSHYITFGDAPTRVPEPAALGLFGLGLSLVGGLLAIRRRHGQGDSRSL